MEIRHLAPFDDRMEISHIYEEGWKFAFKGIIPQSYLDGIPEGNWASCLDREGVHSLVIVEDGKLIGTSSYCKSRVREFEGYGEIISIYLLPSYVGRGYGKKLLHAVMDELSKLGYRDIFLWVLEENNRARRFYEKEGLMCDDIHTQIEIGGQELREVRYSCRMDEKQTK